MKIHICAKYTTNKVYTAIAFVNDKGVIERVECVCNPKTSTKYVGYMHGMIKALKLIEKGFIISDKFDFICDSKDIMRWFESDMTLNDVPKQHRVMFSEVIQLCSYCQYPVNIIQAKGLNYAKRYATEEYYNKNTDTQISGVNALDFFNTISV